MINWDSLITPEIKKQAVSFLLTEFLKVLAKKFSVLGWGPVSFLITTISKPFVMYIVNRIFQTIREKQLEKEFDELRKALELHEKVTPDTTKEELDKIDEEIRKNVRDIINLRLH